MTKTNDEQIVDEEIIKLTKHYKVSTAVPSNVLNEMYSVVNKIGYSCWYADWINHRFYCWLLEDGATTGINPQDYVYHEDIYEDEDGNE